MLIQIVPVYLCYTYTLRPVLRPSYVVFCANISRTNNVRVILFY